MPRQTGHADRGEPDQVAFPPAYFADMAISQRKQLEKLLPADGSDLGRHCRLFHEAPCLDKCNFGDVMSPEMVPFQSLCKNSDVVFDNLLIACNFLVKAYEVFRWKIDVLRWWACVVVCDVVGK